MKPLLLLLLLTLSLSAIQIERCVVLYNSASPESRFVAKHYQQKRNIPDTQLIGLHMPLEGAISIADYEKTIETPLKNIFTKKKLWDKNEAGVVTQSKVDLIIPLYGVPYKTISTLLPAGKDAEGNPVPERNRSYQIADGASIDAELAMLAQPEYKREGQLKNPFFKHPEDFNSNKFGIFLVGRIDAPSPETCIRMIDDAVEAESTGLFGFCYLDKAYKGGGYVIGDTWMDEIAKENKTLGLPTVMEETKDVYVTNYPMHEAALYFGWYSHSYSGPFRNTEMTFKKGSVITHIHSYSASNIRTSESHWVGPILSRGAAATLGNVHEPFLHLTTHLGHFHKSLLSGKTLVESAWCATPALSWHNVVLGDPLYRPFKVRPATSASSLKVVQDLSPLNTKTKFNKLLAHAEKNPSAEIHEVIGLIYSDLTAHEKSIFHFKEAERTASSEEVKVRNLLHQVAYHRKHENKEKALLLIKANLLTYKEKPSGKSLLAIKNILDPPPPPPVEHPDMTPKKSTE